MDRQYEDPRALERQLEDLQRQREELYLRAEQETGPIRRDALMDEWYDSYQDVAELRDRINFAWQDEEYEDDYRRAHFEEFEDLEG